MLLLLFSRPLPATKMQRHLGTRQWFFKKNVATVRFWLQQSINAKNRPRPYNRYFTADFTVLYQQSRETSNSSQATEVADFVFKSITNSEKTYGTTWRSRCNLSQFKISLTYMYFPNRTAKTNKTVENPTPHKTCTLHRERNWKVLFPFCPLVGLHCSRT